MKLRLREIMHQQGKRLADVGAAFIPPKDSSRISRWATGAEIPSGENLFHLARILGCSIDDLFVPRDCLQEKTD